MNNKPGVTNMLDLNTLPKTRKEALEIGSNFYFTGKPCKNGHVSERYAKGACVKCLKEYSKDYQKTDAYKEYKKQYRQTDAYKESQRESLKKHNQTDARKEYKREYMKQYSQTDAYKEYQKQYNQTDARKESQREYMKKRSQTDAYKESQKKYQQTDSFKESHRKAVKKYRKNNITYVVTRGVLHRLLNRKPTGLKVHQVDELLGYSANHLREHLESQFKEGMSWDNWGEWHIDHIKPVSQFKREGITDPKIINALSNLQPLWAEENLKKSDKMLDEGL